jgi:hypothetical protein
MAEFFCNGYTCECGARVRVIHRDKSKPPRPDPGPAYFAVVECTALLPNSSKCGRSRRLTWQDILDLPLAWEETEP